MSSVGVLAVLGLLACGSDVQPSSPFDPNAPLDGGDSAPTANTPSERKGDDAGDGGAPDDRGGGSEGPVTGSRDAGQHCDVVHPDFGCGKSSGEWVTFSPVLEVDRRTGLVWYKLVQREDSPTGAEGFDVLAQKCAELVVPGAAGFRVPEIEDVRTLAAGCEQTVSGGLCPIQSGEHAPSNEAMRNCTCRMFQQGPHPASSGFCRPELPECVAIWTATTCGHEGSPCLGVFDAAEWEESTGCGIGARACVNDVMHWFYSVANGTVGVAPADSTLAKDASWRCVGTAQVVLPGP